MLVDSHCHLDFPDLATQREAVLAHAEGAGVGLMLTISTRVRRFSDLLEIVEPHGNVFCSIGTHPHHAAEEREITLDEIVKFARHPKVVAINTGLDLLPTARATIKSEVSVPISQRRGRQACRS
jgi:TatD DNase family protein